MKLNLTVLIERSTALLDDLVELLSKQSTLLPLPKLVPAKCIESIPQSIRGQPNRPCDFFGLDGRGKEWLLCLGLTFEDFCPQQVSETRLVVRLFVEVELAELLFPLCRGWPALGAIILGLLSVTPEAAKGNWDVITFFGIPDQPQFGPRFEHPVYLLKGLLYGKPWTWLGPIASPLRSDLPVKCLQMSV